MSARSLARFISAYRWPIGIVAILAMSIAAQATMVFLATRAEAPQPIPDYYEKATSWDADQAVVEASQQLGWQVAFAIPAGPEYLPGMPRPVDLSVADRDGGPVQGLAGDMLALRPSDGRLSNRGALVALPHAPGHYRALVRLDAPGLWELALDTRRGAQRFVHRQRIDLAGEGEGGAP